jgi:hypothetical protein
VLLLERRAVLVRGGRGFGVRKPVSEEGVSEHLKSLPFDPHTSHRDLGWPQHCHGARMHSTCELNRTAAMVNIRVQAKSVVLHTPRNHLHHVISIHPSAGLIPSNIYNLSLSSNLVCRASMATLVLAIGVAIYYSAEKVHEHKDKRKSRKALEATQHGPVQELLSTDNDEDIHGDSEHSPVYEKDVLPSYPGAAQHPALHVKKGSKRHFGF